MFDRVVVQFNYRDSVLRTECICQVLLGDVAELDKMGADETPILLLRFERMLKLFRSDVTTLYQEFADA